jgi:hypothetical protein
MPDENEEWTPGMRQLWRETWQQPHMQIGLRMLKELIRPKVNTDKIIAPGYDALVIAAGAYHNSVGRGETIDLIEGLGKELPHKRPGLPEPWSVEALRELNKPKQ